MANATRRFRFFLFPFHHELSHRDFSDRGSVFFVLSLLGMHSPRARTSVGRVDTRHGGDDDDDDVEQDDEQEEEADVDEQPHPINATGSDEEDEGSDSRHDGTANGGSLAAPSENTSRAAPCASCGACARAAVTPVGPLSVNASAGVTAQPSTPSEGLHVLGVGVTVADLCRTHRLCRSRIPWSEPTSRYNPRNDGERHTVRDMESMIRLFGLSDWQALEASARVSTPVLHR